MNRRNLEYIQANNPRSQYLLADDKVRAKKLLIASGLPVPGTIAIVSRRDQVDEQIESLRSHTGFVLKPSRGFGGSGVLVIPKSNGEFIGSSGEAVDAAYVRLHMVSILAGMFSLDHIDDSVLIEELVQDTPELSAVHGENGVSDIRVIVRDDQPVMAMLRIPCRRSNGTANLHQHGLGLGVDLATGITTHAVQDDQPIDTHPDTGVSLRGIEIPRWDEIKIIASRVNQTFGMNYLGADVVIDADRGPLILEVNVRPGLAIQLANRSGLREVLEGRS
jgi:alpha-L-glutamate ligase-like protein